MKGIFNLPPEHDGSRLILSISGGKDSTATLLALRERGHQFDCVFADTEWEAPQTYEYLAFLEKRLGLQIHRVRSKNGGMEKGIVHHGIFPSRKMKWCTKELKVFPIIEYHETIKEACECETVSVVGIRRDESDDRAEAKGFEYEPQSDWYTWRPLIDWTIRDVLEIHNKYAIPVNPLYQLGFSRVGCMPCIQAKKEEIRLMAKHFPEKVQAIHVLETELTKKRHAKGLSGASFFRPAKSKSPEDSTIEKVVEWSKTKHGGKEPLIDETPEGGCYRWGLCDLPDKSNQLTTVMESLGILLQANEGEK